jgi:carbonic anhydrase
MSQNTITNIKPSEALQRLKDGNERFITGVRSIEPMLSHMKMGKLAEDGQRPFAIVLTCSDSRSPAEMIFDQGIGELFVIRVAGNVVAPSLLASVEFAAANFETPIVVVLGHTKCGAIKATFNSVKNPEQAAPSQNLAELIDRIRPAVEKTVEECSQKECTESDILNLATSENVERSMRLIKDQSAIVRSRLKDGRLAIVGAVLDISTGKVDFFEK